MTLQRYGNLSSAIYRWLIDPLLAPLRPRVVRLCLKHNLGTVLDIGCATGAQCRALDAAGIRANGLDLSEAMVAAARAKSPSSITYQEGSAFKLPFPQDFFPAVLLSLALHEHSEKERTRMLREAIRVLKPDGSLVLVEYSKPRRSCIHIPWLIIRMIENLAGIEHSTGFRQFVAADGLPGLLRRHGLCAIETMASHFHTLSIVIVPIRKTP